MLYLWWIFILETTDHYPFEISGFVMLQNFIFIQHIKKNVKLKLVLLIKYISGKNPRI